MAKNKGTKPHGQKLGQHFLFDKGILQKIADTAQLQPEDCVVEVGPGLGTLTEILAQSGCRLVAVELDTSLIPKLQERVGAYPNVSILNRDIMKVNLRELWETEFGGKPIKLIANLPYYITTPIIMLFLESGLPVTSLTVMVQKEVADRLASPPGSKEYGAISVAVQYRAEVKRAFLVPPGAFSPPPSVQSAVLHMQVHDKPTVSVADVGLFRKVVRGCFTARRKTLKNNICSTFGLEASAAESIIIASGIDPVIRAECLTLEQFAQLTNKLWENGARE